MALLHHISFIKSPNRQNSPCLRFSSSGSPRHGSPAGAPRSVPSIKSSLSDLRETPFLGDSSSDLILLPFRSWPFKIFHSSGYPFILSYLTRSLSPKKYFFGLCRVAFPSRPSLHRVTPRPLSYRWPWLPSPLCGPSLMTSGAHSLMNNNKCYTRALFIYQNIRVAASLL